MRRWPSRTHVSAVADIHGGSSMDGIGWIGLGTIAAVGAAGVAILGRVGLQHVDPVLATALRSVVMTAAVLGVSLWNGSLGELARGRASLDGRAWLFVTAAGFCGAVSWLAYFAALRLGPAAAVSALDRLSLPFVFLLATWILGESAGWRAWVGLSLMLLGTWLIVFDQLPRSS